MKISSAVQTIERGNVMPGKSFGINWNEKLARMLSKGIYNNVIRAPIREIACNALDSHRAAGKKHVPIQVHLPNSLEPYFEVRDQGVGLNEDGIYTLFTCYGGSDKDHSNDDIGGFGVGSKAPFAYTDTFNVTAVHDGVKRHFVMHKDELGSPHVTPLGSEPTTECNGVSVRVPVKSTDFESFRENAEETFKWFSVKPIVTGNARYQVKEFEYVEGFKGANWGLLKSTRSSYYTTFNTVVLMANVAYPIKRENLNTRFHRLLRYPLVIEFQNGDLEPAVSREDLNYDERTVQVLETMLDKVLQDCNTHLSECLKQATTLWQARVALYNLMHNEHTRDLLDTCTTAGLKLEWRGLKLSKYDRVSVDRQHFENDFSLTPDVFTVSEYSRARAVSSVQVSKNTLFVLKDCADASARCREKYYNSNYHVYLIAGCEKSGGWDAVKCSQVQKLLKHLGDPETILASSLPKPAKKVMKFKGMPWQGQRYYRSTKRSNWGIESELTTDKGGYYVTIDGFTPWKKGVGELDLSEIRKHAIDLGILLNKDEIWGINKTNTKLIQDNPKWVEIHGFVKQGVEKIIQQNNVAVLVHESNQASNASERFYEKSQFYYDKFGHMQNELGLYVREWHRISQTKPNKVNIWALKSLCGLVGASWDDKSSTSMLSLDNLWDNIMAKYPLLVFTRRANPLDTFFDNFVSYVNMVDTIQK